MAWIRPMQRERMTASSLTKSSDTDRNFLQKCEILKNRSPKLDGFEIADAELLRKWII